MTGLWEETGIGLSGLSFVIIGAVFSDEAFTTDS